MSVETVQIDPPANPADMAQQAAAATAYLKTLAHEGRLMILCHLSEGERSVSELEELLDIPQATVSQMLARLRNNNLVATRRHGKAIYYRLADSRTEQMIGLLHTLFCEAE